MLNAGKAVLSPKRILISRKSKPAFLELLKKETRGSRSAGPLARLDLREVLHRQVEASMKMGAVCHRVEKFLRDLELLSTDLVK